VLIAPLYKNSLDFNNAYSYRGDIGIANLSVCLSVRYVPVSDENG